MRRLHCVLAFGFLAATSFCAANAHVDATSRPVIGTPAPAAASAVPVGPAKASALLKDPDFGVTTPLFGLERTVEMYQWNQAGQGYFAGWSLDPIDSTGFAAGHANPGVFPLPGRQWRDMAATLDGKPLPADVIARVAKWEGFRPGFSALPANMAATFQPDGDGLTSSLNPLDPQIGDLRVTWRALRLPDTQDLLVLRDGRWATIAAEPGAPAVVDAGTQDGNPAPGTQPQRPDTAPAVWWWIGGGLLVVLVAAVAAARRRRHRANAASRTERVVA